MARKLIFMVVLGALTGSLLQMGLGFPPWNPGGILGGAITGLLMYILGGG